MDRKERIIRLLSLSGEGKTVKEEGIGKIHSDGYHILGTTYFYLDDIDDDDLQTVC